MPLLCISLFALLLLPLSLSCNTKRSPTDVSFDYMAIVHTHLTITRENITTLLQNTSCKHKPLNCTSGNADVVSTLHMLNCKMMNLRLPETHTLATRVLESIQCPCAERPLKKRTVTRKRRNGHKRKDRETVKLCKAKAILPAMTECYEMLNTISMGT